jgi:hypothetical protein
VFTSITKQANDDSDSESSCSEVDREAEESGIEDILDEGDDEEEDHFNSIVATHMFLNGDSKPAIFESPEYLYEVTPLKLRSVYLAESYENSSSTSDNSCAELHFDPLNAKSSRYL